LVLLSPSPKRRASHMEIDMPGSESTIIRLTLAPPHGIRLVLSGRASFARDPVLVPLVRSIFMKYYVVAEIDVTDQSWVSTYVKNVTRLIEQRGGRYLARTSTVEKLEGERKVPQLVVIVEWPSRDVAEAFYKSDEYRPYLQSRIQGARNELVLVAGEDITKAAQIVQ
jgi:uncharacterized protein (DUF1330 family)